jgi:hypothetical protein
MKPFQWRPTPGTRSFRCCAPQTGRDTMLHLAGCSQCRAAKQAGPNCPTTTTASICWCWVNGTRAADYTPHIATTVQRVAPKPSASAGRKLAVLCMHSCLRSTTTRTADVHIHTIQPGQTTTRMQPRRHQCASKAESHNRSTRDHNHACIHIHSLQPGGC